MFDPTRRRCDGRLGLCRPADRPPEVVVCEPDGEYEYQRTNRRLTLLHELAHVWHWSRGDGSDWLDLSATVGGEPAMPGGERAETRWPKRMEERVAVVVSWGLMDQLRRPVRTNLPCRSLRRQFVELTGHPPLGPIEIACLPDEMPPVGSRLPVTGLPDGVDRLG